MKAVLFVSIGLLLSGCVTKPSARVGDVQASGPLDAGTPAVVVTSKAGETATVPAGSTIKITETKEVPAQPAKPATPDAPAQAAQPAQPATRVTEIVPSAPMAWERKEDTAKASSGTVDTSVAKHRIEVEERRWLLWVAIGCGIAGVVVRSLLPAWPALSNGLLIGAALAGVAWKVAALPGWIWGVGLLLMGAMVLGYKRAEWDRDGDGIPDSLQRKNKPPSP